MNIIAPEVQDYAERYTSGESEILQRLREKTVSERIDRIMLSGFYQGRLLAMFSKIIAPRRILEIGTFTGYSALCLAEGLIEGGKLITLDINVETNATAKSFWAQTDFGDKIEAQLGEALKIIPTLNETFDLIFIDADKENYSNYYELIFPKVRVGGLIIADNVLRDGEVLNAESDGEDVKESIKALHEYNAKITADERVSNILFALRDGLMITRKEKN